MTASNIGHTASAAYTGTQGVGNAIDASYVDKLKALRDPKRTFTQRMSDWFNKRPMIKNEQVAYAAWMHGRLRETSAERAKLERPPEGEQVGKPAALKSVLAKLFIDRASTPSDVAGMVTMLSKLEPNVVRDLRNAFEATSFKDIDRMIIDQLELNRRLTPEKAASLARAAFTSIMASIALSEEDGAATAGGSRAKIEAGFKTLAEPAKTFAEKSAMVEELRKRIGLAVLLSKPAQEAYQRRLEEATAVLNWPVATGAKITALKADLTTETPAAELTARLQKLDVVEGSLDRPDAPPAALSKLRQDVRDVRAFLQALSTRDADLASLAKFTNLSRIATKLDAPGYVAFRQQLSHIDAQIPAVRRATALARLDEMERGSKFDWIPAIANGDQGIIDMVFAGAQWHADAFELKRSRIDQSDALAVKNLDVQQALRVVTFGLDQAMQKLAQRPGAANTLEANSFARVLAWFKSAEGKVPTGVFRATMPDVKLIAWLMKNVPGLVSDRNLVIASWISLSHYDPKTGQVDMDKVRGLLGQLELQGIEVGDIEQYVKQGFGSAASVMQCRDQVKNFANAIANESLLTQMEALRSQRFKAENLARALIEQTCGAKSEGAAIKSVNEAMASKLNDAAPSVFRDVGREFGEAVLRKGELLHNLRTVRSDLLRARGPADRAWIESPAELAAALPARNAVLAYLRCDDRYKAAFSASKNPKTDANIQALGQAVLDARKTVVQFDASTLRADPTRTSPESHNALRDAGVHLIEMAELEKVNATIDALRDKTTASLASTPFVRKALLIAILQEAAVSDSPDFTAQGKVGSILKRLEGFGFKVKGANAQMSKVITDLSSDLSANSQGLALLFTKAEAEVGLTKAEKVAKGATSLKSVMATDVQEKRAETERVIKSQFLALAGGTEFTVTFGSFGEVSASAPVAPGLNVGAFSRIERNNSIRISNPTTGKFTITLETGGSVRHGLSVSAMADLLAVKGYVQKDTSGGFSFTVDTKERCQALAIALANGDAVDPSMWEGSAIQQTSRAGKQGNASVEANLGLGVATLAAEGRVIKGNSVEQYKTARGEIEVHYQASRVAVKASAELAVDSGSATAQAGVDRSVRKTIAKQYGMFTDGCELTLSRTVVGGNVKKCVEQLLPKALHGRLGEHLTNLGELEDDTEIFVRCRLSPTAIAAANDLLSQADAQVLKANFESTKAGREAANAKAAELIAKAYALTRDSANYVAQGIGYTSKALVEVTQNRKLYENFASTQSLETNFLEFNEPAQNLKIEASNIP
ncbi:MAG TPA: hypothetical protein VLJ86_03330 [Ramlibacter sp.]|nr:hypothetical protein [Ramlibacter sp.]